MGVIDDLLKWNAAGAAAEKALLTKGDAKPLKNFAINTVEAARDAIGDLPEDARKKLRDALGSFAAAFGDILERDLENKGHIRPDDANPEFKKAMGDAFEFGVAAHITSAILEGIYPTKQLGLMQLAQFGAEFAGFKELVAAYHGPLIWNAIHVPSMAKHGKKFRSTPPSRENATHWRARRLIDDKAADDPIAWSGLMPEYEAAEKAAAYRPAQAFALLRGLGVVNVDLNQPLEALRFAGYREQDIETLFAAGKRNGLQNIRNGVIQELVQVGSNGLMDEAALKAEFDSMGLTTDAQHLLLTHIHLSRLRKLATDFKRELDEQAKGKVIPLTDYRTSLTAIGFQPEEVDIFTGQISAFLDSGTLREAAREEAATNRKNLQLRLETIRDEFQKGNLGIESLPGAFAATGLTPEQAALHVALELVRQQPIIRRGAKLSKFAQQQKERAERIRTIIEDYGKGLISPRGAETELERLGVSKAEIAAELGYKYATSQKKAKLDPPTGAA